MDENNQNNYNGPQDSPEPFGQPGYGYRPPYGYPPERLEPVMTVKDWLITLLILMIPCVNIIMFFVWAFSSNGNRNRSNFCKAQLIFIAIFVVISIILSVALGSMMTYLINEMIYF